MRTMKFIMQSNRRKNQMAIGGAIPHLFEIVPRYEELFNLNPYTTESSESICNLTF